MADELKGRRKKAKGPKMSPPAYSALPSVDELASGLAGGKAKTPIAMERYRKRADELLDMARKSRRGAKPGTRGFGRTAKARIKLGKETKLPLRVIAKRGKKEK